MEETRFRIPLYFLTENSEHSRQFFRDKDLSDVVHITQAGVTSDIFASFIKILSPRCASPL